MRMRGPTCETMWFIMWCTMWQCISQSPTLNAMNSMSRADGDSHQHVVAGQPGVFRHSPALGSGHPERMAVDVHRMVLHRAEVQNSDADSLAVLADQRRRVRPRATVDGVPVPIHPLRVGNRGVRRNEKVLEAIERSHGQPEGRNAMRG